ncbi:hypothetical protein [Shewanella sp.]|uniref:hypothetical protein n=1 Tax=Shewanella sp. TaxID=50422 RepID=UPI0040542131
MCRNTTPVSIAVIAVTLILLAVCYLGLIQAKPAYDLLKPVIIRQGVNLAQVEGGISCQ